MNKILVEVSVGELLDKISILEIKKDRIKDSNKLKFINEEYEVLKNELEKNIKIDEKLAKFFTALKNVNSGFPVKYVSILPFKTNCRTPPPILIYLY